MSGVVHVQCFIRFLLQHQSRRFVFWYAIASYYTELSAKSRDNDLLALPTDLCLRNDKTFKPYFEKYAADQVSSHYLSSPPISPCSFTSTIDFKFIKSFHSFLCPSCTPRLISPLSMALVLVFQDAFFAAYAESHRRFSELGATFFPGQGIYLESSWNVNTVSVPSSLADGI